MKKLIEHTCPQCGYWSEIDPSPPKGGKRATDKPYVIRTPLQKVVCAWKVLTGYAKDDRAWDEAHWSRHAKSAASLIAFLGNHTAAIDCCQDVLEQMQANDLSCTIETVVKHSADWRIKQEGVIYAKEAADSQRNQ